MSMIEKLFVQIFERKNSIIEQVRHQTDLYDQHLASKSLIEGIAPPSWLWNPGSLTQSSDPKELKKEELISELLLPRPQPAIPYSSVHSSLYNKTFVTVNNAAEVSDGFFTETHASNKGFDAGDGPTSVLQSQTNDVVCTLNGVPELDYSATSPKHRAHARTFGTNPAPELSLARIQRSKSRQKALEIRNSVKTGAKIRLHDENNTDVYSSGSAGNRIASLQSNHVNELELVEPLDITNDSSGVKEAKIADCRSKEEGCNIYSGRITGSEGSCQQPSHVSDSSMDSSSYIAEKDGDKFAESTGKFMQQLNHVNELLEVINPFDVTNEICGVSEAKIGDCQSKKEGSDGFCGRITRSRSSCLQFNYVNESSKLDSSSNVPNVDGGTLEQSIGKSMQPSRPLSQIGGDTEFWNAQGNQMSVGRSLPSQKDLELLAVSTREDQGKGSVADEDVGRLTRSQTTRISELVNSNFSGHRVTRSRFAASNKSQSPQGTQALAGRSSPSKTDLELCKVNTIEHPSKGTVVDEYVGRSTRSQTSRSIERMSKPVNSSNALGCRITRSRFAASNKPPLPKSLNMFEGLDLQKASGTQVNVLPCTDANEIVSQERRGATIAETEVVSDVPVEDCSLCSGSKLDGTSLRVGLEVLVSRLPSDSIMFVKPKQLDFDDVGEYSLNETISPSVEENSGNRSLEKGPFILLEPVESPNKVTSINHQEKCDSSLEKPLLEEQEDLSKEEEAQRVSSEAHAKERVEVETENIGCDLCLASSASRTSNLEAVSSVKETSELYKGAVTFTLPDQTSSLIDRSTTMKVTGKNSLGSPPKKSVVSNLSNVDADTIKDFSFEKGISSDMESSWPQYKRRKMQRVEVETENIGCNLCLESSASRTSNLEAVSSVKETSELYKDAVAFTLLEQTSSLIDRSTTMKVTGKDSLGSPPKESVESNLSNVDADKMMDFSFKKGITSDMEGSWPQYKRRKIEGQLTNVLSLPPSLRVRPLQIIHRDAMGRYLNSVKDNSEAVLKFQHSTSHEEDVSQSNVNKIPDLDFHQNVNCHLLEGFKYSPKLRFEEGELSLEGRAKSATTPFTFKQENLGPSFVSSLTKQATVGSQGCLGAEVGGASPATMIPYERRECAVEDNQNLLHLEDKLDQENAENLICTKRNMLEKKSHMGEDGLFSYCSVGSLHNQYLDLIGADQAMPVFEGFIVQTDDGQPHITGGGISFHESDLPNSTIEHSSVLEQLCKSASMHTPLSHFSTTYKLHKTPDLYKSVPNGLLERIDLKNALLDNDDGDKQFEVSHSCLNDEVNCAFQVRSYSDGLPNSSARFGWNVWKPYTSPVGKLWERTTSNSGCSEKQGSLNPELTCFTIEEDRSICEEIGNTDEVVDTFQEDISSTAMKNSTKREPLADITEDYQNPPASVSTAEKFHDRGSLDSVNTEVNFTGNHNKVKQKLGNHYSSKRRCTNEAKENQRLSMGVNGVRKATESLHNRFSKPKLSGKSSLRKGGPRFSQREHKRNNIVSNITSFIPLVQKKQAAAVITGKRDIKVKALEAAETAKRLEEKKENERKMKKDALKLERARLEKENLRQLELKKKKKEEEQKKKDADIAARKRLREEEERKEKEGKQRRIDEARRQQREQEEKLRVEKQEKETRCRATDERVHGRKELKEETGKYKNKEKERGNDNLGKKPETEPRTPRVSTSDDSKASMVLKNCDPLRDCGDIGKVMCNLDKAIENGDLVTKTSREQSYDISPYQGSDDEEEEEDEIPNTKFVPSWASKNSLALVVSSQQKVDPDAIFPTESFCSIAEVLLPRKQQLK